MVLPGLRIIRATRKPFYVDAVRVTAENMSTICEWTGGEMLATEPVDGLRRYVEVPVEGARNERQSRAYVGDWVLKANGKFKVYTNKAYRNGFDEEGDLACGETATTLDHEPCVLNHRHKTALVPIGCRSFNDYRKIEEHNLIPGSAPA